MDRKDVQDWAEYELADLKVKAQELISEFFRERQERGSNVKVWPRLKEYSAGGVFYIVWSKLEYFNRKRQLVRTKHLSKGQGASYRKRLIQACQHCEGDTDFILLYEERFVQIRRKVAVLGKILSNVKQLKALEKEEKELLFASPTACDGMVKPYSEIS